MARINVDQDHDRETKTDHFHERKKIIDRDLMVLESVEEAVPDQKIVESPVRNRVSQIIGIRRNPLPIDTGIEQTFLQEFSH